MSDKDDPLQRFANTREMIDALADEIVTRVLHDVAARGSASLVVSGGKTPGPLFDTLSTRDAPWDKVWITLSDERWIAPDRDGSNEYLVRTRLLRGKAAAAHFVGMKTRDATPEAGEATVNTAIGAMTRPFTVMLLGMGDDGHTASLFPHAPELAASIDAKNPALVRGVHAEGGDVTNARMTLTLRAILDSRWIVVLIEGDKKLAAYKTALSKTDVADAPVQSVLRQTRTPVSVYWAP